MKNKTDAYKEYEKQLANFLKNNNFIISESLKTKYFECGLHDFEVKTNFLKNNSLLKNKDLTLLLDFLDKIDNQIQSWIFKMINLIEKNFTSQKNLFEKEDNTTFLELITWMKKNKHITFYFKKIELKNISFLIRYMWKINDLRNAIYHCNSIFIFLEDSKHSPINSLLEILKLNKEVFKLVIKQLENIFEKHSNSQKFYIFSDVIELIKNKFYGK